MHERTKLEEAEYFLQRMNTVANDRDAFRHELSAFMTAGRSVLQYAYKEASSSTARSWYDKAVTVDPILHYFKDKRDISVHSEPIRPAIKASVGLSATLTMSGSLHITKLDKTGRVVSEMTVDGAPPLPPEPPVPATISYIHHFPDWNGPEDVLTLGQQYVNSLRSFVDGGVAAGVIKG